jgi:hypothetical protein
MASVICCKLGKTKTQAWYYDVYKQQQTMVVQEVIMNHDVDM